MLTLFRIMTLEGWSDVMYETIGSLLLQLVILCFFYYITAFAFLNLLIGVIVTVIDQESKLDQKIENSHAEREKELLDSIQRLEARLKKLDEN